MATATKSRLPIVGVIKYVLGVTCSEPECAYHESLHTGDRDEAARSARELGWKLADGGWLCPLCASSNGSTNGHRARRAGKAVRS